MPTPVGSILDRSPRMPFHTDMQRVLRAFGGREREFDWLVTDLECNRLPPAFVPEIPSLSWCGTPPSPC